MGFTYSIFNNFTPKTNYFINYFKKANFKLLQLHLILLKFGRLCYRTRHQKAATTSHDDQNQSPDSVMNNNTGESHWSPKPRIQQVRMRVVNINNYSMM